MKRQFVDSPIPVAAEKDVTDFGRKKHPGPSAGDFCVYLEKHLKCPWNKRAAKVFAANFIEIGWSEHEDQETIEHVFLAHLTQLQRHFLRANREPDELTPREVEAMLDNARSSRRRNVSAQLLKRTTCSIFF